MAFTGELDDVLVIDTVSPPVPIRHRPRHRSLSAAAWPCHAPLLETWAADLVRSVATGALPPRWRAPGFAVRVDAIRSQLAPILDRGTLVASWQAEAVRWRDRHDDMALAVAPLDLAYAVRWLELGQRRPVTLPAWRELVTVVAD